MNVENDMNFSYYGEQSNNPRTGNNILAAFEDHSRGAGSNSSEAEAQEKKLPYPKSAVIVICDEFNQSFFFSAVRGLLVLYLTHQIGLSSDTATIIFHTYIMTAYLLSIIGAIISDSWLGKFKTISYCYVIYGIGGTLITISTIPLFNMAALSLTISGLALIAVGAGAESSCIAPFGGDQFKVPEQLKQLTTFFSIYYFVHNAGSLLSYTITPIFRESFQCFGEKECYLLAFGVANALVVTSMIIFVLASSLYEKKTPAGNMVALVSKTIGNAISTRWKEKKTNPREHWLDYAEKKYDRQVIEDTKVLLRVSVLFLPLPVFWALFEQQGSRWTIQATHTNGDMGSWDIKPDQMQLLSPLLFLVFVPLYDIAIYPFLSLFGIRRPLQKLTFGGILAGLAFIISGLVELKLEQTYPTLPSKGIAQLRVYNGELCDYSITTNFADLSFDVNSLDKYINKSINIESSNGINIQFQFNEKAGATCALLPNHNCLLKSEKSYYMILNSKNTTHPVICAEDTIAKPSRGFPLVRVLANVDSSRMIQWQNSKGSVEHTEQAYQQSLTELNSDTYLLLVDNVEIDMVKFEVGGIYTILIAEESSRPYRSQVVTVTEPNSVSILWLIPQYVVMTLGQVTFIVTGTEFSYTEAPLSMKTVLQGCWLLTRCFGNLIVIIIAELSIYDSQASEFFLFAGLMFADMIVFMFAAYLYKPNNYGINSELKSMKMDKQSKIEDVN